MTTFDDAEVVKRRASRLAVLLADSDAPARPMAFPAERIRVAAARRRRVQWRAAAAIVLLIGGAAGVPPVRAWIVDTVQSAWLKVTGRAASPLPPSAPVSVPVVTMGSVSFPAMDPVTIRIATRQADGGTLTIETAAERVVSAAITGEANAAELVVMPEGLRIVNRRVSTAGYLIRIPSGLSRVSVLIGNERPRVFVAPDVGDRFVVDLGVRSAERGTLK